MVKKTNLKCNKCGYEWEYTGNKKIQATCPDCMLKIKIKDCQVPKRK